MLLVRVRGVRPEVACAAAAGMNECDLGAPPCVSCFVLLCFTPYGRGSPMLSLAMLCCIVERGGAPLVGQLLAQVLVRLIKQPAAVMSVVSTTLCGGSLGSCVDEERSQLCELM
ncbi:hypothetical protein AAHC03_025509 [Spirometra sp. Aus1]